MAQRFGHAPIHVASAPRLQPCEFALLQIGDDLVCDFLIDVLFHFLFSFVWLRMQPNCPSGEERGETVTDRRQRWGIAHPAQAKRGRMGRPLTAPEAYAKGLVLTAKGVADPKAKGRKSARQGWHQISARDGSRMAETANGGLGSRQPDPPGFLGGCANTEDQSSLLFR